MLTKQNILGKLNENRPYLAAEYGVSKIGLFGSRAKGNASKTSDVDLIIEFDHPIGFKFVQLVEHLETILDSKVDVLTPAGLNNIRVNGVAKSIAQSIEYVKAD